jgi:peptide/nickel transport system permease protein
MTDLTKNSVGIKVADKTAEFDTLAPSPRELMRGRARSHLGFITGLAIIAFFLIVAIFANFLAPHDPYAQTLSHRLADPVWGSKGTWDHILGTDALGRDVLSRLMYGARLSLYISFTAAIIAAVIGVSLGVAGGYFGGRIDAFVVYIINVKLALPVFLVALSIAAITGGTVTVLILLLGFLTWDRYAIVTRSLTQQLRDQDFVMSSLAAGASHGRIIFRDLLPNLNHIIVIISLDMAVIILIEAALSFLGLGIRPPTPSWGLMISEARAVMFFKPHLIMVPGIAIFILVMAINMAGDGIRDVTAPEGRG